MRRVYLITGRHDDVVDDAAQVRKWLTDAGVPVRVSTPKDMGHEVALDTKPAMYQAALRWLEEFIPHPPDGPARHEAEVVLQQLKAKLN